MKIAYIIPKKNNPQNYQTEKDARDLAVKLEKKGHEIIFLKASLSLPLQNFDVFHFLSKENTFLFSAIKLLKRKSAVTNKKIPAVIQFSYTQNYNFIKELEIIKNSYLLFVGQLKKKSGAFFLAETFKNLEDKHLAREKKLILVNRGQFSKEYLNELKDCIRGRKNIQLFESLPQETLRQLYSNCYLYVDSSSMQKLNQELLEAMNCQAAPLVSGKRNNLLLIGEEAGFSFRAKDADDLENKLAILINSPLTVKEIQEKAATKIEQEYSLERLVSNMETLYTDILLQKREKIILNTYGKNI